MTGLSWHPGCPVPLRDLRLVRARHWGFDARVHTGRLVVHRDVARAVVRVLRRLYAARFPIRRMVPVDAYGGEIVTGWITRFYPYLQGGGTYDHPNHMLDLRLSDPQWGVLRRRLLRDAKVGAEIEQVVLNRAESFPECRRQISQQDHAQQRIQLVDRPVGRNPTARLGDKFAAAEHRLPGITGLGVDAIEVDHREEGQRGKGSKGQRGAWGLGVCWSG